MSLKIYSLKSWRSLFTITFFVGASIFLVIKASLGFFDIFVIVLYLWIIIHYIDLRYRYLCLSDDKLTLEKKTKDGKNEVYAMIFWQQIEKIETHKSKFGNRYFSWIIPQKGISKLCKAVFIESALKDYHKIMKEIVMRVGPEKVDTLTKEIAGKQ